MKNLLLEHKAKYPEMQAQDFFKLLYQSEFGGGHLISDRGWALEYLKKEISAVHSSPQYPFESIGGGLMRLYLPAEGLRPETILGLFLETCRPRGSMDSLNAKLDALAGLFPGLKDEIAAYRAAGCPAQRHSEAYRSAYSPAYRLVPEDALRFLPLFRKVDALLQSQPFVRIAIDGRCASGKSTLGELLSRVYGANLFHMDDYFLPFERKTPERLAEPGGNVDYERFYEEIAAQPRDAEILWHPFDCSTQALSGAVRTAPTPLTIVEGSYSLHPALRDSYDLKIFLDIDPERQSERIRRRNSPEMHARFINEWIPLENRYFDGLAIRALCDLSFDC